MPYVPRPPTTAHCAHCNVSFEKRHASRKYCSNSCNVQASYARNGRPGDGRATRADLEQMLTEMKLLLPPVRWRVGGYWRWTKPRSAIGQHGASSWSLRAARFRW